MRRLRLVLAVILAPFCAAVSAVPGFAQSHHAHPSATAMDGQAMPDMKDMNQLSKALVNPISMVWNLNNYIEVDKREGSISPETHWSTMWSVQPVLPVMLNASGLTSMNRPSLPFFLGSAVPRKDAAGQFQEIERISGMGDLTLQSSLGKMPKTSFGHYMWGLGATLTLPTATDRALGSGKYSVGPAGMLVGYTKRFTFGSVFAQSWSFAGHADREDVNELMLQPIYYFQLGNGWQVGDNAMWHIKWNGSSGGCTSDDCGTEEESMVPVGLGLFNTRDLFGSPWRFGVTPRYYVRTMERWGNQWGVNFTVTKVLPNPSMKMGDHHMNH